MDKTKADHLRVVALPGLKVRVILPDAPGTLYLSTGGTIDLGRLAPDDLTMLGMGMLRDLRRAWHPRMQRVQRLSNAEADKIGADLIHDAVAQRIAVQQAKAECYDWADLSPESRAKRVDTVRDTLRRFLEELNRE